MNQNWKKTKTKNLKDQLARKTEIVGRFIGGGKKEEESKKTKINKRNDTEKTEKKVKNVVTIGDSMLNAIDEKGLTRSKKGINENQ